MTYGSARIGTAASVSYIFVHFRCSALNCGSDMLAILDQEWNEAIEVAAKEVERHALALRSANGESEAWVWPAANSAIELAARVRRLKRSEYPKVDSDGLRMAAEEGHARVSSVVNVKSD